MQHSPFRSGCDAPTIVISGFGLVTPLACGAWQTYRRLLAGDTIADRAASLPDDLSPHDLVRCVGGVSVARHAPADPAVELAERATREAITMAPPAPKDAAVGIVLGAGKGAVVAAADAIGRHSPGAAARRLRLSAPPIRDAELAIALGPHGYLAHHLEQRLGLPVVRSVVAACASSLTAVHAARQVLLGRSTVAMDRLIVVTAEAALLPVLIESYRRLGVLAPLTPQGYRGRPGSTRRDGFMLSELAAAVVLDRLPAGATPAEGTVSLLDTAVACEAYDLIRPHPTMPALEAIARRLLADRPLDLLHPHLTGTVHNDPIELAAYDRLGLRTHAGDPTPIYASKGALGHALGSAGLASLVLACVIDRAHQLPPMPWLGDSLPGTLAADVHGRQMSTCPLHQAVLAAGFGGHVAGAVIARDSWSAVSVGSQCP